MRRFLLILMVCCLLVPSASAEDALLNRAVSLGAHLDDLASAPGYLDMWLLDADALAVAESFAQGDHTQPRLVVDVRFDLPEEYPQHLLAQAVGSALGNRHGVATVMAYSILTSEDIFASDFVGGGALLLLYEDAAPVYIAWHGQDGAVRLTGMFLPAEEALDAATTAQDVADWLSDEGFPAVCSVATDGIAAERAVSAAPHDLLERAIATAARMAENANATDFAAAMGMSPKSAELAKSWAQGSAVPAAAYTVDFVTAPWVFPDVAEWPEGVRNEAVRRMENSYGVSIAARVGTEALSAVAMLSTTDLFASDLTGSGYILLMYDEMQPVLVNWRGQDGAVSLNALFLPGDDVFAQMEAVSPGVQTEPIPLPE